MGGIVELLSLFPTVMLLPPKTPPPPTPNMHTLTLEILDEIRQVSFYVCPEFLTPLTQCLAHGECYFPRKHPLCLISVFISVADSILAA